MAYYIGSVSFGSNDMAHFGVKGMKWGVRRYENQDGTLTAEGRQRYGEGGSRGSKLKKFAKVAGATAVAVGGAYALGRGLKSGKIGSALRKAGDRAWRTPISNPLWKVGNVADRAGHKLRDLDRYMGSTYEDAKKKISSTVKSTVDGLVHRYADVVAKTFGEPVYRDGYRLFGKRYIQLDSPGHLTLPAYHQTPFNKWKYADRFGR